MTTEDLRAELDRVPPPQAARLLGIDASPKIASVIARYDSRLSMVDVAQHYTRVMTNAGWQPCGAHSVKDWGQDRGDRAITYAKGVMTADIFIPGASRGAGFSFEIALAANRPLLARREGCP